MRSSSLHISPYVILTLILTVSVLGTAWVAAQFEHSAGHLDFAHAVPGKVKFVGGVGAKSVLGATNGYDFKVITKKSTKQESTAQSDSYWYRYHAHLLPIAVGFFMLTLSGWSLLGVENLAIRTRNS